MPTSSKLRSESISGKKLRIDGADAHGGQDDGTSLLPNGSKATVFAVLQALRDAGSDQFFSQSTLRDDLGMAQFRQGMGLLRFLAVLKDNRLTPDVIENRGDLKRFRNFIRERVQNGCRQAQFPQEVCEEIGMESIRWESLCDRLRKSQPIAQKKPNVQNNLIGAFKGLHEALQNMAIEGWLEARVLELTTKKAGAPSAPVGAGSRETSKEKSIPVPYGNGSKDGNLYFAHLVFEDPSVTINGRMLRRIASQLIQMADIAESDN